MNKIYYAADIHRKHEKNQTITKYILYKKILFLFKNVNIHLIFVYIYLTILANNNDDENTRNEKYSQAHII